ncbi:putative protein-like [Raphanus sativus]|nr:putative protein-like [Raphanus sativus]
MKGNQRQVSNERRRQSLRIRKPPVSNAKKRVAQKKNKKKSTPVREPSIHSPSVSSGSESEDMSAPSFEDINSVLVPTLGEEIMLACIIDEERDYDRQGSPSDTWNYWLNVKQKTIWWEELYELDQAARVFPKKKDKAEVELAEGSSSQTGLDSILKGLEGRLVEFMGTTLASLNFTVEAKLESIDSRMSKMEERLTSIESKLSEEKNHGEDMDFRQWDHGNYGDYGTTAKDKGDKEEAGKSSEGEEEAEKSEGEGNKDKENSEADEEDGSEQERVLNRMKDDELWRSSMEDREEVG